MADNFVCCNDMELCADSSPEVCNLSPARAKAGFSGSEDTVDRSPCNDVCLENYMSDNSPADSSDSEADESDLSLRDEIALWALQFNISHIALNRLLCILRKIFPDLPKDSRTVLQTCTTVALQNIAGGFYYHFGLASGLISIVKEFGVHGDTIKLQINIDGLPLSRSSNAQFWPILGLITNCAVSEPYVIGLFYGHSKPNSLDDYLHQLVSELAMLQSSGLHVVDRVYTLKVTAVVCDTPARAFVKNIKGHSGYSGCDKCVQEGSYVENRMTFPETSAALRTDESFGVMMDEEHHLGPSPLNTLSIGMVTCFPIDYMHLSCLGVMRKLMYLWIRGPRQTAIGSLAIKNLSEALVSLRDQVPVEFARKPRKVSDLDRWKATELRQFMLYTGPVCLRGILSDTLYSNFMLLSVGMFILLSPDLCSQYCQYAGELLKVFVENVAKLFGEHTLSYNVHATVHLAEEVRLHGCLDNVSGFVFENYLGKLKKLIRTPNAPLQQVVNRLSERSLTISNTLVEEMQKEHCDGPLPSNFGPCLQFREYCQKQFRLIVNQKDNCALVGDSVVLVRNFVKKDGECFVVYQKFKKLRPFYTYPVASDELGVYSVSHLDSGLRFASVTHLKKKCILLSLGGKSVAFPLLHI